MRIRAGSVSFLIAVFLSCSSAAHAMSLSDLLDFLGELSGPGPFKGHVMSVDLVCREQARPAAADGDNVGPQEWKWLKCMAERHRTARHLVVGPVFSVPIDHLAYTTSDIPQSYRNATMDQTDDPRVRAVPLAVRVTSSPPGVSEPWVNRFDVGVTAGTLIISGTGFDAFPVSYFELPNLTFRPLRRTSTVGVELGWTQRYVGSVSPGQFNAPDGPDSGAHWQTVMTLAAVINKPGWDRIKFGVNFLVR